MLNSTIFMELPLFIEKKLITQKSAKTVANIWRPTLSKPLNTCKLTRSIFIALREQVLTRGFKTFDTVIFPESTTNACMQRRLAHTCLRKRESYHCPLFSSLHKALDIGNAEVAYTYVNNRDIRKQNPPEIPTPVGFGSICLKTAPSAYQTSLKQ